jgi:hypothetical protein
MRWRALALALVLSFGLTSGMEAKQKPYTTQAKAVKNAKKAARKAAKKSKGYKLSKASKVKPRKAPKRRA